MANLIVQKIINRRNKSSTETLSMLNPESHLSAFSLAILMENWQLALLLQEAGADDYYDGSPFQRDHSPIFLVCEKENVEVLDRMCDSTSTFRVTNSRGETPLTFAARAHKVSVLNYLTLRQKDLNAEDQNGHTALIMALLSEDFELVERLTRRGANLDHLNSQGKSALSYVIEKKNVNAITFLLKTGIEMSIIQ